MQGLTSLPFSSNRRAIGRFYLPLVLAPFTFAGSITLSAVKPVISSVSLTTVKPSSTFQ